MCRNIRILYNVDPPTSGDEVRAAAVQYVRKISGFTKPSRANEEAFARAVDAVTHASRELLAELVTAAPPRDRELLAERAPAAGGAAGRLSRAAATLAACPADVVARDPDLRPLHGRARAARGARARSDAALADDRDRARRLDRRRRRRPDAVRGQRLRRLVRVARSSRSRSSSPTGASSSTGRCGGRRRSGSPSAGSASTSTRERLRSSAIDPDRVGQAAAPHPRRRRAAAAADPVDHLLALLSELHREDVLEDEEYAAKRELVRRPLRGARRRRRSRCTSRRRSSRPR